MKRNLLLILLSGFIWLPSVNAQLLTDISDTTRVSSSTFYVHGGASVRLTTGYRQMRNFYEEQGFNYSNSAELISFGVGREFKNGISYGWSADLMLNNDDTRDVKGDGFIVSLRERKIASHLLLGYRFWQKRYTSLTFQMGVTFQQNRVDMEERLTGDFDFTTANINNPRGVRSIPTFLHGQSALHIALRLKIDYPRMRWLGTDEDIKLGFVSAFRAKPWSVSPGQTSNAPVDRLQYIYLSTSVYFFPREEQYRK